MSPKGVHLTIDNFKSFYSLQDHTVRNITMFYGKRQKIVCCISVFEHQYLLEESIASDTIATIRLG